MSRKGIYKYLLVLFSAFKEFLEFSPSSAAQLLKLRLQTKPSLKQIFRQKPFAPTGTKLFDLKIPVRFSDFVICMILTRNLTHYRNIKSTPSTRNLTHYRNIKSTPSTNPLQYFFKKNFIQAHALAVYLIFLKI